MTRDLKLILVIASMLIAQTGWADPQSLEENYFQVVFDTTHTIAPGYRTGFGYAVYVNFDGVQFLFDTGADAQTLAGNLKQAGIDPDKLAFVGISHDHSDHIGGMPHLNAVRPDLKVYKAPGHKVGVADAKVVSDSIAVTPNIYLIRTHTDQPTAGISDELSLLLKTKQGPYLFTGCSHTGVATIVDKARAVAGSDIFYYTGGSRLVHRPAQDTREVAGALKARNVAHVSPGHCSVSHAVDRVFKKTFPTSHIASRLGEKVPLEP